MTTAGERFARALAAKDFEGAAEALDSTVDFRGMTPRRIWEASTPDGVAADILPLWFEDSDHIDELVGIDTGRVGDCERIAWRFRGHNDDGPFIVEQQAYYEERDDRIVWMRVLCSGFRPA